jgi:hypothetical protein
MSEDWLRPLIVVAVLGLAALAGLIISRKERRTPYRARQVSIAPGIYLFTSSSCAGCDPARRFLVDAVGPDGFVEVRWEDVPERFTETGIEEVPATLVVTSSGLAMVYPGHPELALQSLGP